MDGTDDKAPAKPGGPRGSALARNHPRLFRGLSIVYVLVIALLLAEIGARVGTYVGWKRSLTEFPEIERRHDQSRAFYPAMTIAAVTGDPAKFPAAVPQKDGPPRVVPFGELSPDDFASPLPIEKPRSSPIRIAFVGGSTTFDGYPDAVGARFTQEVGPGKVEVLNLGVPASNSATTLVTMRRFLPKLRPEIVVVYHGFNDVVYYRARAEAERRLASGGSKPSDPALDVRAPSRGVYGWLFGSGDTARPLDVTDPMKNYEAMASLGKEIGFSLYVSTFASPSYGEVDAQERRYFEAEIRHLWPPLVDTARYTADIGDYNEHLRGMSPSLPARLIDVAKSVHGGRTMFKDNCHLTGAGRDAQAKAVLDALLPEVRRLLEQGGKP